MELNTLLEIPLNGEEHGEPHPTGDLVVFHILQWIEKSIAIDTDKPPDPRSLALSYRELHENLGFLSMGVIYDPDALINFFDPAFRRHIDTANPEILDKVASCKTSLSRQNASRAASNSGKRQRRNSKGGAVSEASSEDPLRGERFIRIIRSRITQAGDAFFIGFHGQLEPSEMQGKYRFTGKLCNPKTAGMNKQVGPWMRKRHKPYYVSS